MFCVCFTSLGGGRDLKYQLLVTSRFVKENNNTYVASMVINSKTICFQFPLLKLNCVVISFVANRITAWYFVVSDHAGTLPQSGDVSSFLCTLEAWFPCAHSVISVVFSVRSPVACGLWSSLLHLSHQPLAHFRSKLTTSLAPLIRPCMWMPGFLACMILQRYMIAHHWHYRRSAGRERRVYFLTTTNSSKHCRNVAVRTGC